MWVEHEQCFDVVIEVDVMSVGSFNPGLLGMLETVQLGFLGFRCGRGLFRHHVLCVVEEDGNAQEASFGATIMPFYSSFDYDGVTKTGNRWRLWRYVLPLSRR
jgi:hypothetical protein